RSPPVGSHSVSRARRPPWRNVGVRRRFNVVGPQLLNPLPGESSDYRSRFATLFVDERLGCNSRRGWSGQAAQVAAAELGDRRILRRSGWFGCDVFAVGGSQPDMEEFMSWQTSHVIYRNYALVSVGF